MEVCTIIYHLIHNLFFYAQEPWNGVIKLKIYFSHVVSREGG